MLYKQLNLINLLPPKDTTFIDLGCGDGRLLHPFYTDGYPVVGVDSDPDRIKEAKEIMPDAKFVRGDIQDRPVEKGFVIMRSVLPFLESKEKAETMIKNNLSNSMYFTLFGPKDEKSKEALTWTRDEVDTLMSEIGNVVRFSETIGRGINLAGGIRKSHIFEIIRIV
jgi:trans-aconitate methyltransferase